MVKLKAKRRKCSPFDCGMEDKVNNIMERFTRVSEKLTDNQIEMRLSIQKLSDNIDSMKSLSAKQDKLEEKVDKNSQMVWKMAGGMSLLALAVPVLLNFFM